MKHFLKLRRSVSRAMELLAIHRETGRAYPELEREDYEVRLQALSSGLGEARFASDWQAGTQLTFDQAVDYAISQQI